LLLDLGNTDSVWLFPTLIKDFVYNRPNVDDFLGRGFSGDIFGKRSSINSLSIGKFRMNKPSHQCLMNILSNILKSLKTEKDLSDRKSFGGLPWFSIIPERQGLFQTQQTLERPIPD
jgi:hypothetical protein